MNPPDSWRIGPEGAFVNLHLLCAHSPDASGVFRGKDNVSSEKSVAMKMLRIALLFLGVVMVMSACTSAQPPATAGPAIGVTTPDWFRIPLTDVQTGRTFTMADYKEKVVLVETMAIWCPNCLVQASQVRKLHEVLGNPEDLISVSLDVDPNETDASLKEYASSYRLTWHFAVAPLLVARALGNLYSAEYLNPPLSPMLIIDRAGNVHQLAYGLKDADTLQKTVEPYLGK
jgi:cytochrome oxidase Cu insertion factor (SCO1/SenC/PrrC family)